MTQPTRISYVIMAVLLVLIGWLHLGTLVLTALFGFFALGVFSFGRSKFLGLGLYVVVVVLIGWGLFYFSRQAYLTLPKIAETTIPAVAEFAERQHIELPFTEGIHIEHGHRGVRLRGGWFQSIEELLLPLRNQHFIERPVLFW